MTIFTQSITPHGQPPAFPPNSSINSQEISQQVPVAPLLNRSHSNKSFQSSSSKKTALITACGSSAQGESFCKKTDTKSKNQEQNSIFDYIGGSACKFSELLNNREHSSLSGWPITQVEQGNTQLEPFTLSFFRPLGEKEKFNGGLKYVKEEPNLVCLDPNETLSVAVASAVELERKQMDQIARKMQRLTGSINVRLENVVDPSLIAGFIITYEKEGFHVIDLSVKGQLAELVARLESTDQSNTSHGQNLNFLNNVG